MPPGPPLATPLCSVEIKDNNRLQNNCLGTATVSRNVGVQCLSLTQPPTMRKYNDFYWLLQGFTCIQRCRHFLFSAVSVFRIAQSAIHLTLWQTCSIEYYIGFSGKHSTSLFSHGIRSRVVSKGARCSSATASHDVIIIFIFVYIKVHINYKYLNSYYYSFIAAVLLSIYKSFITR